MSAPTAQLRQCTRCNNLIDPEDLFCDNCGTEAPLHAHEAATRTRAPEWQVFTFDCNGCGASMSYDAAAGSLRCPFCGATDVERQPQAEGVVYPERVIPFALPREEAQGRFREWLGKGFWRPGDLARSANAAGVTALFLPCWCFRGDTETVWAADVGARTRSGWRPDSGSHQSSHEGVLVPASGGLKGVELDAVADFAFEGLVETGHDHLEGALVEGFGLTRKGARERARSAFERAVQRAVSAAMGTRKIRNLHCNVLLSNLWSEPILLPVWIFSYRYKGQPYRFVMNGQTGKATGKAPFSYLKLALVIGGLLAVLAGIVALLSCAGVVASAV